MSDFAVLSTRERTLALGITIALAALLAAGFIPTSQSFFRWIYQILSLQSHHIKTLGELASFPLLSLFFYLSLPGSKITCRKFPQYSFLLQISLLPLMVAFTYGWIHPGPSLVDIWRVTPSVAEIWWYLLFAPVGEEILFRGWFYNISERLWPKKMFTATNPFPTAMWTSAIAFSFWHIQNLSQAGPGLTTFQILYTFFAGLWLGYLRWKGGGLFLPITFHLAVNWLANLP